MKRLRTLLATSALGAALVASGFAEAQTSFGGVPGGCRSVPLRPGHCAPAPASWGRDGRGDMR